MGCPKVAQQIPIGLKKLAQKTASVGSFPTLEWLPNVAQKFRAKKLRGWELRPSLYKSGKIVQKSG